MSATRRDRFTARLPMLSPPHREGGVGALRVEARGHDETGARATRIIGIAELIGTAAAAVAAAFVELVAAGDGRRRRGDVSDAGLPTDDLLAAVGRGGVRLQAFTGIPSHRLSDRRPPHRMAVADRSVRSRAMTELRLPWLPDGRLVRIEGRGELFVREHRHADPAAPVVLLLHGWTASSDLQFFTAYEALAERCSFIGIDHRGHGRGLRSPDAFTLEDAADDAAALVRHLGVGPVVAVGYSMGGPIALHLTRRHPDVVAGIVVQATAPGVERHVARAGAVAGAARSLGSWLRSRGYRRYLNRAVPKLHRRRARRSSPTCRGCSARCRATMPSPWSTPGGRCRATTPGRGRRRCTSRRPA